MPAHLVGAFGGALAKPFFACPLGGQHAALAPFPGGPIVDDVMLLPEALQMIGEHVVQRLVGGSDQAEVGVAIEHSQ